MLLCHWAAENCRMRLRGGFSGVAVMFLKHLIMVRQKKIWEKSGIPISLSFIPLQLIQSNSAININNASVAKYNEENLWIYCMILFPFARFFDSLVTSCGQVDQTMTLTEYITLCVPGTSILMDYQDTLRNTGKGWTFRSLKANW